MDSEIDRRAGEPLLMLGALRDQLDDNRKLLGYHALMAAEDVLTGPTYPERSEKLAWRTRCLERLAEREERLLPWETVIQSMVEHNPVAAFEDYEPLSPIHGLLDGREALLRVLIDRDLGRYCDVHVNGEAGSTRWVRAARFDLIGIKCRVPPVPLVPLLSMEGG